MTVFLSYARLGEPHDSAVLTLAQDLRANGIDADCDQFHAHPKEGWYKWMEHAINGADRILVVPSKKYSEKFDNNNQLASGAAYEGAMLSAALFDAGVSYERIGTVLLEDEDSRFIPLILKGCPRYKIPRDFESLIRWLTDQPSVVPRELGEVPRLNVVPAKNASQDVVTFQDLCRRLQPLMSRNRMLFQRFGPNSAPSEKAEIRWDLDLWEQMKKSRMLPNNEVLLQLVEDNLHLVPRDVLRAFEAFVAHLHGFIAHAQNPELDYREHQFPPDIEQIVEHGAAKSF